MFTGLVEALGRVERVAEEGPGRRLSIAWPDTDHGESLAQPGSPPTPTLPHKGGGSQIQALPPCGGGLGGGSDRATTSRDPSQPRPGPGEALELGESIAV